MGGVGLMRVFGRSETSARRDQVSIGFAEQRIVANHENAGVEHLSIK